VLHRLPAGFALPNAPASVKWTAPDEGRQGEEIEFSWAGETARHVGAIVHRWLQRIADDGLRGWDAKRVEALKERFAEELERRGVPHRDLKVSVELVTTALKNAISDERGRWVLGPHPEARSEHRIRVTGAAGANTYIVDRIFRTAEDVRWIVDYKTSSHEGADAEAFLEREKERYRAQLERYAAALSDSRGVRLGLYFPLLAGWRDWE
jgi:ATP-dependent exoDNAse (exonuclease V) beta subunit